MASRFHPYDALQRSAINVGGAECQLDSASGHVRLPPLASLIREAARHRREEMSLAPRWKGAPFGPASPSSSDLSLRLRHPLSHPPHSPISLHDIVCDAAVPRGTAPVQAQHTNAGFEAAGHELVLKLITEMQQATARHPTHAAETRAKMDVPSGAWQVTSKSIFDFTEHHLGVVLLACWDSNQVCIAVCGRAFAIVTAI